MIQSLPMVLKAGENLTDAIVLCMRQIANDSCKLAMLQEEIDSFFTQDAHIDYNALKALPVLDAFYKESVRLDSLDVLPRYTHNGCSLGSIKIPPRTMVLFDFAALNKAERYWSHPNLFNPLRFLPDD